MFTGHVKVLNKSLKETNTQPNTHTHNQTHTYTNRREGVGEREEPVHNDAHQQGSW